MQYKHLVYGNDINNNFMIRYVNYQILMKINNRTLRHSDTF